MTRESDLLSKIKQAHRSGDVSYLIETLHTDPEHRQYALNSLLLLKAYEAVPAIRKMLRVSNVETRQTATWVLRKLGAKEASEDIVHALSDTDPLVRARAAETLGEFRFVDALDELRRVFREDPVTYVRTWALGAIGEIDAALGIEEGRVALDDEDWMIRSNGILAFGRLGGSRELEGLQERMDREPSYERRRWYRAGIRMIKARLPETNWLIRRYCRLRKRVGYIW